MGLEQAIDITAMQRKTVLTLLRRHLPRTEAWVYGSRTKWTARPQSDLDLVVFSTPEQRSRIGALREAFEESDLPFRVDLFVWDEVPEEFREEIETEHVVMVAPTPMWRIPDGAGQRQPVPFAQLLVEPVRNGIYKKKKFHGRGIKVVNMGELFAFPRLRGVPMKRVELSSTEQSKFLIQPGDLLFARRSLVAEGAGKCSIVLDAPEPTTFESSIIRARPNPTQANSLFLYYYFNSHLGLHALDSIRRQVAVAGITGSDLARLDIQLPSLVDQRKIAHILGTLDDKIELNRRMNETLEAMARAIFKDWFVDFGPTRAKMGGSETYLPLEIWGLFPDALDNEGKPEGWKFDTLARLAATNDESWTTRRHPPVVEYVALSNAKWGNIGTTTFLDWEDAPSRARRVAKAGDTIVGTTRPGNGSFAYVSKDGLTVSTGFAVLSPLAAKYRDAVYLAATSTENIKRLANLAYGHGGTYPAVKPAEVSDTPIVFPGDNVLAAFARLVSPVRDRVERSKTESQTLTQTRDLLLPKLVSGEIRLHKVEDLVGEACAG